MGFVLCAGLDRRVEECPTPLLLRDKSQSVRARCNKALAPCKIGIFSSGIRTSGLEVLPKGALTVLPMQSGAINGSTQGASQDNSCGVSQENTGYKKKFSNGRRTSRRSSRCFFKRALAVLLLNANECVGQGESPLLNQCRRQDLLTSHGQASALTEVRAE